MLRYYASDMILVIETDAAYLVQPEAKSRASGWFILTNKPATTIENNAPIHVMCTTIKNVVASAAEAEVASIFLSCQRACPIKTLLKELGHPQPPEGTPIFTDNRTAKGILTSLYRQKLSKAFDMSTYIDNSVDWTTCPLSECQIKKYDGTSSFFIHFRLSTSPNGNLYCETHTTHDADNMYIEC